MRIGCFVLLAALLAVAMPAAHRRPRTSRSMQATAGPTASPRRPKTARPNARPWSLRTLGASTDEAIEGGPAWRRRSDSGVDYWLRADDTGIYRVASKSDLDDAPKPDKPQRFVLRAPFKAGTQWQASTTAYLLMRRNEFPREIRHEHPNVPMSFQIEAEDETVEVPAGRYPHCLRIKGTAMLRLYADPVRGWRDMPLTTTEWYCRGVGLVRVQRDEPAERLAYLTGGTRTLELESWQ